MKNIVKISMLALAIALTACNKGTSDGTTGGDTITLIHELDTVQVKHNPTRVVALDYVSLENLDVLGIKVLGVPKEHLPHHLARYGDDPEVVDLGSVKEVNFEKLAALNPEVIFMSERLESSYPELKKIAPVVYIRIDQENFLDSFRDKTRYFGTIFGKEKEVDAELSRIDDKIKAAREKIEVAPGKGLVTLYNGGKFSAYGRHSRFGFIHEALGVKEAVENIEVSRHGQPVSSEFIQQTNPDYLFVIDRGAVVNKKAAEKSEIENVLVQKTNAYKNGKIVYLNPEIWYLAGGGITSVNAMIDEVVAAF
ncbi:siderophore ABC transporter substrate-binding protein [Leadbetterella sp. DM7]|uniref:siderophore ABC transporter substrate-binding protein n=1 Tax=Leadbetterella sp. DM7 TaxID=3235085 RepID=UPI00349F014D